MPVRQVVRRPIALSRSAPRRHRPDYLLVLLSSILLVCGLIVVYAISPGLGMQKQVSENYYVVKQLIAIGLGIAAFGVAAVIPLDMWRRWQQPLIITAAASAVAVRMFGERVNGAYRWIQIGGLSFQAVELIKFALIIWLAFFLTERIKQRSLNDFNRTFKPLLIALVAIGFTVAVLQSDLGSTGVLVAMMAAMCFIAGLPLKRVLMLGGIIAIGTVMAVSTSAYRRERLMTFLQPTRDCQAAGYQACQALNAIGSGGMFGKGIGGGVHGFGYLPEAANDSIFAIMAEKFGFVGVTVLLGLLLTFFTRLVKIMERAPDVFSRLVMAGILAWLSTQAIINIGAMVGLLPLKGITLPFISYGGTSIIFVTAAVGLAFNISRYTTYSVNTELEEGSDYENSPYGRGNRRAYYTPVSRRT